MRRPALVRRGAAALVVAAAVVWFTANASAQLDPLLFVKRVPPSVIIAMDTSFRMQMDLNGNYYDPNFYLTADDPLVANALGMGPLNPPASYRRVYQNLQYESTQDANTKFVTDSMTATPMVWDPSKPATADAPSDLAWLHATRLAIAKRGVASAVSENAGPAFRWGLVKLRQDAPAWRLSPDCDKPVRVVSQPTLLGLGDNSPCKAPTERFAIYVPTVNSANYSIEGNGTLGSPVAVPIGANTSANMLTLLNRKLFDPAALIPAGRGTNAYADRPITHLLDDVRAQAVSGMQTDTAACRGCRNTIVVLITSGADAGDPTYDAAHDAPTVASTFLNVSWSGVTKRVPIYVIGLNPPAADVAELQAIAANSGGRYFSVTDAAGVARVVNLAVQAGFSRGSDFDTSTSSEFTPVSPIVGTVNLKNASDANGALLPATDIQSKDNQQIPQRSNVLLSAGFALPGFDGRLRAFRVFKPVADSTKPSGWKFVNDGTRLWPDLDGRPWLAGLARTPLDATQRNVFTFIPDGAGGGTVVSFDAVNATTIGPHLALPADASISPAGLIGAIRGLPIGAIIGSTPALMDAPSLDPPPDTDYGRPDGGTTFAGKHKDRRSLIFFGANDGMIHCVDARTGYEVWAFIPYNLLPKLRTLLDGQPVEQFDYFVDSSPKIAEVKRIMPDSTHQWRSMLIIGQGPGGVFYQAFDVTEAGMAVPPDAGDLSAVTQLLQSFDTPNENIQFLWSFPNYSNFNPAYTATFNVIDGTPGGKVKLYGDLTATATNAEKSVGFSWSDPAVGPLNADRTVNAVMVGSGYFPPIEDLIPARGSASPRAGRSFYMLRVEDGTLIGNSLGASCSGNGCLDLGDVAANGRKNAVQADPTAAGLTYSHIVSKAYIGDVDGNYWRLNLDATGTISKFNLVDTAQPIYASSALLFVGSVDQYAFFATGSDLLPASAPGGTGTFKLYGLKDNFPAPAGLKFTRSLAPVSLSGGFTTGERPSTSPSVAGDIVFYTTTSEDGLKPCVDYSANLYGLTYLGGAAYDTDNNAKMDVNESPVIKTVTGRATAPFIVDQHLYMGLGGGINGPQVETFGDPEDFNNGVGQIGVRILSWREIR